MWEIISFILKGLALSEWEAGNYFRCDSIIKDPIKIPCR